MATNPFFNHFPESTTNEQNLVEDLIIESIKIYGMDVYYLPRTSRSEFDYIFGEDQLKQYVSAKIIEMYLENVTSMGGDGDWISRFGLEIRDELRLTVSRKRFLEEVEELNRPREGDLIFIPLISKFFEVTFVEHEDDQAMFHTLGKGRAGNVYLYSIALKQHVFSNEIIKTNVKEIDDKIRDYYPRTRLNIIDPSGEFIKDEVVYQGNSYSERYNEALVYEVIDNSSIDVYRNIGIFTSNTMITGNTSGANANVSIVTDDEHMNNAFEDIVDNVRIEEEAALNFNFDINNPFGDV